MANRADITPELLRQLLRYEHETGKLFWLPRTMNIVNFGVNLKEYMLPHWNRQWGDKEAFTSIGSSGYFEGSIFARDFRTHRVAWAIHYGNWPAHEIDHINGNKLDNRIENLRDVPHKINNRNNRLSSNNTSGAAGVSYCSRDKKWRSAIWDDRRTKSLGYFTNKEDAIAARRKAEAERGFHVNHGMR